MSASACNSNFFTDSVLGFDDMLELSKTKFTNRFALMKFVVVEQKPAVNSLLCAPGDGVMSAGLYHFPVIVHRTGGGASAEELNECGGCGAVIGNWHGMWVALDQWSESSMRNGRRME